MPAGLFLGGAPYNVAYHLHRLGCEAQLVSRVGDDRLGREALRRLGHSGLRTGFIQVDPFLPTGFVQVEVDEAGLPVYEIVQPAAWDEIALNDALRDAAEAAPAVVFGSLAQRQGTSRQTARALLEAATLAVFDVNLRPPFVSPAVVQASLDAADFIKLNSEELATLAEWFDLPGTSRRAVEALADRFECRLVCVTRGSNGAVLWHEGRWLEHAGYAVAVKDTVGAGDAFLAGLLGAIANGANDPTALDQAARLGAFVASQPGATPQYNAADLPAPDMP